MLAHVGACNTPWWWFFGESSCFEAVSEVVHTVTKVRLEACSVVDGGSRSQSRRFKGFRGAST
jgi:hypothetical protein